MVEQATIPEHLRQQQRFPISAWNKELAFQFLSGWEIQEDEPGRRWLLFPKGQDDHQQFTVVDIDFNLPEAKSVRVIDGRTKDGKRVRESNFTLFAPTEFTVNPDPEAFPLVIHAGRDNPYNRLTILNDGSLICRSSSGSTQTWIRTEHP